MNRLKREKLNFILSSVIALLALSISTTAFSDDLFYKCCSDELPAFKCSKAYKYIEGYKTLFKKTALAADDCEQYQMQTFKTSDEKIHQTSPASFKCCDNSGGPYNFMGENNCGRGYNQVQQSIHPFVSWTAAGDLCTSMHMISVIASDGRAKLIQNIDSGLYSNRKPVGRVAH
jgi:hypothetical protein